MSRLIESIRLYNGEFSRLDLHQDRIDNSCRQVFGKIPDWRLKYFLMSHDFPTTGLHKCRVIYDEGTVQAEFSSYQAKPVQTLKLIIDNEIDYRHKWEERLKLNDAFGQRENCDDILIVRNGLITDTFYGNMVFQKNDEWFTPESFLLPGTMRQFLLNTGVIKTMRIDIHNFRQFSKFKLINAMVEWDGPAVDVSNIY
jgi:4-amino-4-deoxychorismate lyase